MDDGTVLVESAAILDAMDTQVGATRALLPTAGASRREALRLVSLAIGAGEKAPGAGCRADGATTQEKFQPWVARCREQMHGALGLLEVACRERGFAAWLVDDRLTQADVASASIGTFLKESLDMFAGDARYPALRAHVARCEALPEFQRDARGVVCGRDAGLMGLWARAPASCNGSGHLRMSLNGHEQTSSWTATPVNSARRSQSKRPTSTSTRVPRN